MNLKSFALALLLTSFAHAQETEEKPPTDEDIFRSFSVGTIFGLEPDTNTLRNIFGPKVSTVGNKYFAASAGQFSGNDHYVFEVGTDLENKTSYVHIQKKTLTRVRTISDAEVLPLLYKVAGGGIWTRKDTEKDYKANYRGAFWEYLRDFKGNKLRFFAYRLPNENELLIYSPKVSPDLDGTSGAPGTSFAFRDGTIVPWTTGDPSVAARVTFIDIDPPAGLVAAKEEADDSAVMTELSKTLSESLANSKRLDFLETDYIAFRETRTLLDLSNKGGNIDTIKALPLSSIVVKDLLEEKDMSFDKLKNSLMNLKRNLEDKSVTIQPR